MKRILLISIPLLGSVLFLSGCSGGQSDAGNPEHQKMLGMTEDQRRQAEADEIKNNPKIPEGVKQGLMARYQGIKK